MPQIKLFTGQLIEITEPEREVSKITIENVRDLLSRIMRFNGQHPGGISVLEHSILTSKLANFYNESHTIQLFALLHDAAEMILSDIPSPVKHLMPSEFFALEDRWEAAIYKQFVGRVPYIDEKLLVKKYDDMAFIVEVGFWAMDDVWIGELDIEFTNNQFLPMYHSLGGY